MTGRSAPNERSLEALKTFGVVVIDKPPGPSSHQVSAWVKEMLDIDRAGHAGTLDPAVTGCLPILLGDATRLAQALLIGPKRYIAVLELHDQIPATCEEVLDEFVGEIIQKPPRKSAVRRRIRTREIYALTALETTERQILLDITCESGTYIRKLCHDLGLALGVGGHMGELRRLETTPFDDTALVTLHELADAIAYAEEGDPEVMSSILQPAEVAVSHLPQVTVAPTVAESVSHGSPIYAPGVIDCPDSVTEEELVACRTPDGTMLCLGRVVGDPTADHGKVVSLERVVV